MKSLVLAACALVLSGTLGGLANAGTVVQFKGQTDPVTQNKTLADAQTIAGVDLLQDTSLSQADLDNFDAALNPNFLGCYTIPMMDPETGLQIGLGIDCLAGINGGVQALSLFVFPGGTLVTTGQTSVSPFAAGVGDGGGAFTHITGSVPAENDRTGIVGGTRRFRRASGSARVSGAVNLTNAPGNIIFDCLWELDLDPRGRP